MRLLFPKRIANHLNTQPPGRTLLPLAFLACFQTLVLGWKMGQKQGDPHPFATALAASLGLAAVITLASWVVFKVWIPWYRRRHPEIPPAPYSFFRRRD